MSKLLFWIVVVLVVLLVMRLTARHAAARHHRASPTPRRPGAPKRYDTMVQCAHCGVHLPAADALHYHGKTWCSREHAQLGSPE